MSKNVNGIPVICVEPELLCFICGKIAETRPYGPNGEEVCFDCGMKDERSREIQMNMRLFGDSREEAELRADEFLNLKKENQPK